MTATAWRAYLAAGIGAIAVCFALPADSWWQLGLYCVIGVAGVAGMLVGVRVQRPRRAVVWWVLAAGVGCLALGDLTTVVYIALLHDPDRFPSAADIVYLTGAPLMGIGMVLLVRAGCPGRDRAGPIDAMIVTSGVGLLTWVFLVAPTAGEGDLSMAGELVSLAYPIWDVLLLALLVRLLAGAGARVPALRLLVAACAAWLVSDIAYAVLLQYGAYIQGGLTDAVWLLGFVLFGASALHPSLGEVTQPGRPGGCPGAGWRC